MRSKRKLILYIAMSLDGFIADCKGGVEWLNGQGNEDETIDSYAEFVKGIDTVLMGWNTYDQVVHELSPNEWVYQDFKTYVFTHRKQSSSNQIQFVDENPKELVRKLKLEEGKDFWICGGANLIHQLMDEIDVFHISIIPTLLGGGIRLFENQKQEIKLKLCKVLTYNGINELIYVRR